MRPSGWHNVEFKYSFCEYLRPHGIRLEREFATKGCDDGDWIVIEVAFARVSIETERHPSFTGFQR